MKCKTIIISLFFMAASLLTAQETKNGLVRLSEMASEHQNTGDFVSAEKQYLHALEVASKSEPKHTLAALHENLGTVYAIESRYADAEKQYKVSYDLLAKEYGEHSPRVAIVLDRMGEVSCLQGHFSDSISLFRRSLDILRSVKKPNDKEIGVVLANIAAAQWRLGHLSKSEKLLNEVEKLFDDPEGQREPAFAFALEVRAGIAQQTGDLSRAATHCQRALSILERCGSRQELSAGLVTMGYILLRRREFEQAGEKFQRARGLITGSPAEEGRVGAALFAGLAQCDYKEKRSAEAGQLFERAIAIYRRVLRSDHPELLYTMQKYAKFLRSTKRKKQAKELEAYVSTHEAVSDIETARSVVDVRQLAHEKE
jgi:tetratricopeptide (TPR) repeat protein